MRKVFQNTEYGNIYIYIYIYIYYLHIPIYYTPLKNWVQQLILSNVLTFPQSKYPNPFLMHFWSKTLLDNKLEGGVQIFSMKKILKKFRKFQESQPKSVHKKWSFPLRSSLVNLTRPAASGGFGHIYWINP